MDDGPVRRLEFIQTRPSPTMKGTMKNSTRQARRRRRTNSRRSHGLALALGALSALLGLTAIVVGVVAWSMDRPEPQQLLPGETSLAGRSPWFDSGTTLFVAPLRDGSVPGPADLGCTLFTTEGDRSLRVPADADVLGTRVVAQTSLEPSVHVGTTGANDRLMCSGPRCATRSSGRCRRRPGPRGTRCRSSSPGWPCSGSPRSSTPGLAACGAGSAEPGRRPRRGPPASAPPRSACSTR